MLTNQNIIDRANAIDPESFLDQPPTFSVTLIGSGFSPTKIEQFFLEIYNKMKCRSYDD